MKIFWPPPNFCSFPDFVLEESVWHAINLWGHWKACSFTRDQNHSSNHSGVIKNFILIKQHYMQVQFNPFQASVQFQCHLKTSEKRGFLIFPGSIVIKHWLEMGKNTLQTSVHFLDHLILVKSLWWKKLFWTKKVDQGTKEDKAKESKSNCPWMPDETTSP